MMVCGWLLRARSLSFRVVEGFKHACSTRRENCTSFACVSGGFTTQRTYIWKDDFFLCCFSRALAQRTHTDTHTHTAMDKLGNGKGVRRRSLLACCIHMPNPIYILQLEWNVLYIFCIWFTCDVHDNNNNNPIETSFPSYGVCVCGALYMYTALR